MIMKAIASVVAFFGLGIGGVIFLLATPSWIADGRIISKGETVEAKLLPKDRWVTGSGKGGRYTKYFVLEVLADNGTDAEPHEVFVESGFSCSNVEGLFATPSKVVMDRRLDRLHWGVVPKCYATFNSWMNWLAGIVFIGLLSALFCASYRDEYQDWMADPRNQPGLWGWRGARCPLTGL